MKIKKDFVLRRVLGTLMVMPLGEQSHKLSGMMTLTESGAILWEKLEQGCDMDTLTRALTDEYDVTEARARADAEKFVEKLTQLGCLDTD